MDNSECCSMFQGGGFEAKRSCWQNNVSWCAVKEVDHCARCCSGGLTSCVDCSTTDMEKLRELQTLGSKTTHPHKQVNSRQQSDLESNENRRVSINEDRANASSELTNDVSAAQSSACHTNKKPNSVKVMPISMLQHFTFCGSVWCSPRLHPSSLCCFLLKSSSRKGLMWDSSPVSDWGHCLCGCHSRSHLITQQAAIRSHHGARFHACVLSRKRLASQAISCRSKLLVEHLLAPLLAR